MQRGTQNTSGQQPQQPGHYSFPAQSLEQVNLNINPSTSERTGRKSYKLANGRGRNGERKEAVWPLALEEALLDGLKKYRPLSKSGRPLRRFTKRNVIIAQHIFKLTGQTRTAKQVGSRLQQITESTKDPEIIHLITCRDPRPDYSTSSRSSPASDSPLGLFANTGLSHSNTPSSSLAPGSPASVIENFEECTALHAGLVPTTDDDRTSYLGLDADLTPQGVNVILTVNQMDSATEREPSLLYERVLSDMPCSTLFDFTPSLSIISWRLSPESMYTCTFTVSVGSTSSIHVEERPLSVIRPSHPGERCTYSTEFLPSFWNTLPPRPDLECYSITVDVYEVGDSQSMGPVHRMALAIGRTPPPPPSSYPYVASSRLSNPPDFDFDLPLPLASIPSSSTSSTSMSELSFNHMPTSYDQMSGGLVDSGMSSASWGDTSYYAPTLSDGRYLAANQESAFPDHLAGFFARL